MAEPYLVYREGWERFTLEPDMSRGFIDSVTSGSTPSTTREEYWDGEIPWLTPKELDDDPFSLYVSGTERTVTPAGVGSCSARVLQPNTVMVTKRAPVGLVAVNTVPMATNQGFLNFGCGPKLRPLYLAYWFLVNRPYLDKIANGSTFPELYRGELFEFEVAVPSIEDQDATISVLQSLMFALAAGRALAAAAVDGEGIRRAQEADEQIRGGVVDLMYLLLSGQIEAADAGGLFNDGER